MVRQLRKQQEFFQRFFAANKDKPTKATKKSDKNMANKFLSEDTSVLEFQGSDIYVEAIKRGKKKIEIELKGKNIRYTGKMKPWWKFMEGLHEFLE